MINKFMSSSSVKPWLLWGLLFLLLLIRLYHINGPIVDRHSWNQISAASMAKHIYYDWGTLFHPTVDMYISHENPSRVYIQEFPLYHIPIALMYYLTGVEEWPARLVTIIYSMVGLWYLFLLARRYFGEKTGWITLLVAGFSPLNWFYHQAVMGDSSMVTAMIAGYYYFCLWVEEEHRKYYWYSLFWTMAAGIFKPFGLVIGVAYFGMILLRKKYFLFKKPQTFLFVILAWLPTIIWIIHAMSLQEGISEFTDANSMNQIRHPELLLTLGFYERLLTARLLDSGLTPWAGLFCIIGIAACRLREDRYHIPILWMVTCIVYAVIVQHGNHVHEYYQLPFIPGLALLTAIGVEKFWYWKSLRSQWKALTLSVFLILFIVHSSSYFYRFTLYDIGSYNTGVKVAEFSESPEERILAFDTGSNKWNQLIYYSNLTGWYWSGEYTLDNLELFRKYNAAWLGVNMLYDTHYKKFKPFLEQIGERYPKVWEDPNSLDRYGRRVISQVYDLRKPLSK